MPSFNPVLPEVIHVEKARLLSRVSRQFEVNDGTPDEEVASLFAAKFAEVDGGDNTLLMDSIKRYFTYQHSDPDREVAQDYNHKLHALSFIKSGAANVKKIVRYTDIENRVGEVDVETVATRLVEAEWTVGEEKFTLRDAPWILDAINAAAPAITPALDGAVSPEGINVGIARILAKLFGLVEVNGGTTDEKVARLFARRFAEVDAEGNTVLMRCIDGYFTYQHPDKLIPDSDVPEGYKVPALGMISCGAANLKIKTADSEDKETVAKRLIEAEWTVGEEKFTLKDVPWILDAIDAAAPEGVTYEFGDAEAERETRDAGADQDQQRHDASQGNVDLAAEVLRPGAPAITTALDGAVATTGAEVGRGGEVAERQQRDADTSSNSSSSRRRRQS